MSVKQSQTLKSLQTRKSKALAELQAAKDERKEVSNTINHISNLLKNLDKQIEELTDKELVVSEHAILRYLERKYSLDLEVIRKEIATDSVKDQHSMLGSGKYPIGDGMKAVIKDNTVVSVTGKD